MSITAPIAGAYTGSYAAAALGYTRSGYNLNFVTKAERLEETDIYGQSLICLVDRGMQMTIDTICKIYSTATIRALFPWVAGTFGRVYAAANPISQIAAAAGGADSLVLTVVANTPAATGAGPTTLTAATILASDQNLQLVLSSVIREVPLRWDVFLSDSAGVGSLFTTT
jgi:hypothetical protein